MMEAKMIVVGSLNKYDFDQADRVISVEGISPSILAHLGNQIGHQIQILVEEVEDETDSDMG